jgi:uncharacterized protein (DUF427 family)
MKAVLKGKVIADSDDIVHAGGYAYFPLQAVRLEWLEKANKTASDRACPHGVQFYDVIIDGAKHARTAWIYEAPHGDLKPVAKRVGFWKDVEIG